jgi:hypothetical protein
LSLGIEDVFREEITDDKFEDCLQDEEEKQEEPALHFEETYFDAPSNNLGNHIEPIYEGNRKRVVRFLEDEESMDGGSMMVGGLAAAGGIAAAGMLASKASDALQESDASISMLDIFDKEGSGGNDNNSISNVKAVEDDASSDFSLEEEEEQEKKTRKTLLMTMLGMGFMGLVGFGTKKLMNVLSRNKDQDLGAGDVVGDGIDTATNAQGVSRDSSGGSFFEAAAEQASLNASANASSQGSSSAFAMFTAGNNPAAMTGAQ